MNNEYFLSTKCKWSGTLWLFHRNIRIRGEQRERWLAGWWLRCWASGGWRGETRTSRSSSAVVTSAGSSGTEWRVDLPRPVVLVSDLALLWHIDTARAPKAPSWGFWTKFPELGKFLVFFCVFMELAWATFTTTQSKAKMQYEHCTYLDLWCFSIDLGASTVMFNQWEPSIWTDLREHHSVSGSWWRPPRLTSSTRCLPGREPSPRWHGPR